MPSWDYSRPTPEARAGRLGTCLVGILVLLGSSDCAASPFTAGDHRQEIRLWQAERLERLRSETGWLTLVGLHWLQAGENRFGSDPSNKIVLPEGTSPPFAGSFLLDSGGVRLRAAPEAGITIDGKPVMERELRADDSGEPDILRLNNLFLYVIRRGDRLAIRVKDPNSPIRKEFPGLEFFPVDPAYRFDTELTPYDPPREVAVPNVLGTAEMRIAPGVVKFSRNGRTLALTPVVQDPSDRHLFFIFADETNGKGTYGGGRFLYADLEDDGKVTLDFNKAYTPPCAFTPYATCPLPPIENRLPVRIEAGETYSGGH